MKLLPRKRHNSLFNFFNKSLPLDTEEVYKNTINKIITYYSNLDYSVLSSFEYTFFENTLFNKAFINNLLSFNISIEKKDNYGLKESLREIHIPSVLTNEELQYEICYFFNIWVIKRFSYRLTSKNYPFSQPNIKIFDYLYLDRYISLRESIFLLSKIKAGPTYTHSNIYDKYLNLYASNPSKNISSISSSLYKSEEDFIKKYANNVTKKILKK